MVPGIRGKRGFDMTFTDGQILDRTAVKGGGTLQTWSKLKTAYVNVKQRYAID